MKKDEYLKALKDAEIPGDDAAAPVVEKTEVVKPEPVKVERVDRPSVEATPAAPVVPAEPELFPGFNALPEERRTEIKSRWKLADEATARQAELDKKVHEFNQLHQRLAPTQQQLSKMQLEYTKIQKELNELRSTQQTKLSAETKAKLEEHRAKFPEDVDLMESLVNPVLAEAEAAKKYAASLDEKMKSIEERMYIQSQIQVLSQAHPDWQELKVGVQADANGYESVVPTTNTEAAKKLALWSNSLDPYDHQLISRCLRSRDAKDTIYVLNRFKQDDLLAQHLMGQTQQPTAPPAQAAPVADPDPARRATAPSLKTAGQPKSDKQRELEAAADYLRKSGKLPPKQRRA